MKPNYLFGLTKKLIKDGTCTKHGIVVDGYDVVHASMGTPCVVVERLDKRSIAVLFPFVSTHGHGPRVAFNDSITEPTISLKTFETPSCIEQVKILDLAKLSEDDIKRSIDYAKKIGPLTLMIKHTSAKDLITELTKMVDILTKSFTLNSVLHKDYYGNVGLHAGETAVFALTFTGINHCLPIYDPDKVDGIITYGAVYYPERSRSNDDFVKSCEFSFGSSNFKENFTCIDGQKLFIKLSSADALKKVVAGCKDYISDIMKSASIVEVIEPVVEEVEVVQKPETDLRYYLNVSASTSNTSSF